MVIKHLILEGYNRFFLSNIEKLDYRPHNTIQMIASRNSSGKSSLLRQLNPLPVDMKKDFKENGYKFIEIEHNNNIYKITSSNKNSFICNDVELNPGGTKKVQLELVKEHFNITPQIMDILYNSNNFTNMTASERKYWFTEMSNIDYKYPLSVYNTIRSKHRDIVGYIKLLNDDIIKSKLNLLDNNKLDKLNKDRETLENYISYLTSQYDNNVRTDDNKNILDNIKNIVNKLSNIVNKDNNLNLSNLEETYISKTTSYNILINNIDKLKKDIDNLDKIKDTTNDITTIDKNILELNTIKDNILKKIYIELNINHILDIKEAFDNLHNDLISFTDILKEYEDVRKFNKEDRTKLLNMKTELEDKIRFYKSNISLLTTDIQHMDKHKEDNINCPNCKHTFNLVYDPIKYKEYTNKLDNFNKELLNTTNKYNKLNSIIDKSNTFIYLLDNFKNLINSNPILLPIWSYVFTKLNIYTCNSTEFLTMINKLSIDLNEWSKLFNINKELELLLNKKSSIEQLNITYKDMNKDILSKLILELEESIKIKNNLIKELDNIKSNITVIKTINNLKEDLKNNLYKFKRSIDYKVKLEYNNYLLECINLLKSELVKIETTIKDNDNVLNTINRNTKLIEENKKKEKVLSIAMKILSPDEGLIAKSINDFITTIIEDMNKIINSIWTYDLELLPCGIDENNDLDYKFKVRINNDYTVEDISKLSSSGKEIVDLAFKLVLVKFKNLIDIPLYLDEFGTTFDQAHRQSAYQVIDKIISSEYKQIFIVCHYSSIYGSLKNMDFNVLDSNNIELDTDISINEVMKIDRY